MIDYIICLKYLLPFFSGTFQWGLSHSITVRLGHMSCCGQWNVRSDISHFQAESLRNTVFSAITVKEYIINYLNDI